MSQAVPTAEQISMALEPHFAADYGIRNRRATIDVQVGEFHSTCARPHIPGSSDPFLSWWKSFLTRSQSVPNGVNNDTRPLQILDLFSSVGGLTLGVGEALSSLGIPFEVIAGVDVDLDALASFQHNHHSTNVINRSVADLVDSRISGRGTSASFAYSPEPMGPLATLSHKADVLIAGPPCQGHSTLNNHTRGDDPKNRLYLTIPAIAVALSIPIVIIENVPNVVHDKEGVVSSAHQLLKSAGYRTTSATLAAHKLGWPQTRRRYFLVATKDIAPIDLPWIAKVTSRSPASVEWAIEDLVDRVDNADVMLAQPTLSSENRQRIAYLFESGEHNLPLDIRPECHRDGTTYKAVYGRMIAGEPAPTITTGFVTPGRGRFIHPLRPRVLTPREAARIQGFPDWFEFIPASGGQPTRSMVAKWIGDAVPSILGFTAALAAAPSLLNQSQLSRSGSLVNQPPHLD